MRFLKKNINKLLVAVLTLCLLALAGCGAVPQAEQADFSPATEKEAEITSPEPQREVVAPPPAQAEPETEKAPKKEDDISPAPSSPLPTAEPKAEEAPAPIAPMCTISIRCDTALSSPYLPEENRALLPENGVIMTEREVVFSAGESAFDVLLRETRKDKIHFEHVSTPMYDSVYIEGIANLYELDCGELSGWMYRVNGVFPSFGISKYTLSDGDRIELLYTCDLGADIGRGTK